MIERMVIICIFRIIYGFICSQEPFYPKIELEVKKLVKNKEKSAENKGIFRPPRQGTSTTYHSILEVQKVLN